MKKLFTTITIAIALFSSAAANAAAIIDPLTGAAGYTEWHTPIGTGFGLSYPVSIFLNSPGNQATITVGSASTIDFSISDEGVFGDAFALTLDGVLLSPTSGNLGIDTRGPSATSFFSAFFDDIFLSAGTHTFSLFTTDACCTAGGTISPVFSAATPVPEASTYGMMLAGLGLVGAMTRRRKSYEV